MAALVTFWVTLLSDKLGRKMTFDIIAFSSVIGAFIGYYINDFYAVSFSIYIIWTAQDIFYSMTVLYFNEISSNAMRSKVTMFYIISTISAIGINVVLMFFTNYKDFFLLLFVCFIFQLYYFVQLIESPFFCHQDGRILEYH